jgi:exodeoxyribonuclease V gamma subunit
VRYRYGDTRATDYLDGWLRHLFLNLLAPPGAARTTTWHSRDGHYALRPVANPEAHLAALLGLYARGLQAPLHFFPRSAWAYAQGGGDLRKAANQWHGNPAYRGEKDYAAYRLALRGVDDPLDAEFEEAARAVFDPLLAHLDDARLAK